MRHLVFGKKLSRDTKARKALLANLANSLIEEGKVTTTLAKAQFARPFVEKLVTKIKTNKLHKKRETAAFLTNKAFKNLLDITAKLNDRTGGYTKIVKLGSRRGDAAKMAQIEFINWQKPKAQDTKQPTKKKKEKRAGDIKLKTKNKEGKNEKPN